MIDLPRDLKSLEKFIAEKLGNEIPEEKPKVKTFSSNKYSDTGTNTLSDYPLIYSFIISTFFIVQ